MSFRYDVFDIEQPLLQYNITVDTLRFNEISVNAAGEKHANWTKLSTFYLNPSKRIGRSSNSKVKLN